MPIRGETIGAAYVRILADGTGFEADAERQLRETEPTFEKEGTRHGQAYARGFQDGLPGRRADPLESFEDALEHGVGKYDRIGQLLGRGLGDGFENEVRRLFPDVGDRILENLRNDLANGSIGEVELIDRLHNLRAEAARAYQDIADRNARVFNQMEASVKRYADGLDNSGRSRLDFLRDIRRMVRSLPDAVTNMEDFAASVTNMRRELVSTAPRLKKYRDDLANSGTLLGRVFGKGSRNDFLNFVGSFMQGINTLIRGLASFYKWPGLVAEQVGLLISKFVALRDEQGTFGAIFSMLRTGAGGLVSLLVGVVAAVSTISVVLPAFGALVVGVTGMVLALAGSLGFALAGGAAVAAGALFPLAAAMGVAALAMGGLDKKNKEVKANLKALKDEWKELQGHAARGLFGKDGGGLLNLKAVIEAVEPIVKSVSKALGGLLDDLGKTAKTKEFNALMEDLGAILGPMVTTLGRIAGNLGLGLVRAFIILEPYITDFLGWMEDVSKAFADAGKTTDTKGLTGLADFFDKAAGSAMRLWDLVTQVGAVLGTLFGAGKSTGDNLITGLADQAEKLNQWLTSPEGQQALRDMFDFAEQLAEALGRAATAAFEFIGALDTPQSRQALLDIVGLIETIFGLLTMAAGPMTAWLDFTQRLADYWRSVGSGIVEGAGAIIDFFASLPGIVGGALMSLNESVSTAVDGMGQAIQQWFGALPAMIGGALATMQGTVVVAFSEIGGAIGATLGDIGATVGPFFASIGSFFSGIGSSIAEGVTGALDTLRQRLGELPGEIMKAFASLPANIWSVAQQFVQPFVWIFDFLVGHSLIPDLVMAIVDWFARLPGMIFTALGDLAGIFVTWVSGIPGAIAWIVDGIASVFGGLNTKIITAAGDVNKAFSDWFSPVKGIAERTRDAIVRAFAGLAGKIIKSAGSFSSALAGWLAPGPGQADKTSRSIAAQFSGMASDSIKQAGSLSNAVSDWGNAAVREANHVADGIVNQFRGLSNDIEAAIGTVHIKVVVDMPSIPRPHVTAIVDMPQGLAVSAPAPAGPQATSTGAQATPSAMNPTAWINPGGRDMSGFSGDLRNWASKAKESAGTTENNVAITVITPTEDPRAVASEVFARLAASSYV